MRVKKKVAPVLTEMQKGAVEVYPIEQLNSLRVTVSRLQMIHRRSGIRWSLKTRLTDVVVTRTA